MDEMFTPSRDWENKKEKPAFIKKCEELIEQKDSHGEHSLIVKWEDLGLSYSSDFFENTQVLSLVDRLVTEDYCVDFIVYNGVSGIVVTWGYHAYDIMAHLAYVYPLAGEYNNPHAL